MSLVHSLGLWEVPSTASLHSGVHPSAQRAQWWDGGRQEVCPQVKRLSSTCQQVPQNKSSLDAQPCLLQHARANRAVPSPARPAKPGGRVSRCYLFMLRGVHQQVSVSLSHIHSPSAHPLMSRHLVCLSAAI